MASSMQDDYEYSDENTSSSSDKDSETGYSSPSSSDDDIGYSVEFPDNWFQCIICKSTIREFTELPCGHAGCKKCIEGWEKTRT